MSTSNVQRDPPDPRHRGIALVLVMIALVVGTVLAVSFLSQQSTATAVASNVTAHSDARAIAESALQLAVRHLNTSETWREDLDSGVWAANVAWQGGTYTVSGVDGYDADNDGTIDADETDGDLTDDDSDPVTITVTATFGGVTHTIRSVVSPTETAVGPITVLMVVADKTDLTHAEQTRQDLIESWGWTVNLINGTDTVENYAPALAEAHVVYAPEDGGGNTAGARLASTTLGVVFENAGINHELGLSTGSGAWTGKTLRIVDNTHYITSPFEVGELTFAAGNGTVEYPNGSIAASVRPLAWRPDTEARVIAVVDTGQTLVDGSAAKGRRTVSPFSGFDADDLTEQGQTLLKRMLEWSAQSAMTTDAIEPITDWTEGTTIAKPAGEDRLLVVTVGAETHSTVTAITYGGQALTLAASAYESTGVGARTYVYYLRESGIAAATSTSLSVTWSASADDKAYASRMYQFVHQATPIRATNTNTNAGPLSISTLPLTVSNGDVVIGTAQVGHGADQGNSYAWTSPMVMGVNDVNSSSTHTAADYEVTADPGSVTPTATVLKSNRQALIGVVIQPRSSSSGEGIIPQTLVLYEFDESQPDVELVGHWNLDDTGSGGALAVHDTLFLEDSSVIDGYNASAGAYSASNKEKPVILVTNTGSSNGIRLDDTAKLYGSTYNDPGSNPTTVVSIASGASITGNRYEMSNNFTLPAMPSASGSFTSLGTRTYSSGTTTFTAHSRFTGLTVNSGATLRISGNVIFDVTDDFYLNGGKIEVPAGSSLTMYVADECKIYSGGRLNNDTTGTGRLTLYSRATNKNLILDDAGSVICGTVHVGRDLLLTDGGTLYGAAYVYDDLSVSDNSALHIDRDLPGYHIVPVADDVQTNDALANGGVTFSQAGAQAFTSHALGFDGSNDFILVNHHDDYLLHHGSISFWFRSEHLTGKHALFSKDSSGYDTGGHLHIHTDGSTLKARLQTDGSSPYGSGNDFTASKSGLATNTWYHVVVTLGAGGLKLYVNGALAQTQSYPGALADSSGGIGNYQPLVLGAGTESAGDLTHLPLADYFKGRLDDVRIYREVLDADQITNLYNGNDPGDRTEPSYVVHDTSGLGEPLDLFIDDTSAVSWVDGGGLTFDSGTILRSPEPPSKVYNGITATGEFTLELILKPASTDANPRRLLWFGADSGSNANVDLRMQNAAEVLRLRNEDTTGNPPDISSSAGLTLDTQYHILAAFDGEYVRFYRDGLMTVEVEQPGALTSWDDAYSFTLANLPAATSPWLGTLQRVAVYDRAMNQRQVDNLVNGLPPGDGATTAAGDGRARWLEPR